MCAEHMGTGTFYLWDLDLVLEVRTDIRLTTNVLHALVLVCHAKLLEL